MNVLPETALLVLCLIVAWFFSGIETGLISINRLRLRHLVRRKVPGAEILQWFLQNPDALLGTTLVGTNIAVTVASILAVSLGSHALGPRGSWLASVIMTLIILAFCEYFPKAWFQSFPAKRSLPFARVLEYSRLLLLPIGVPLMRMARLLVPVRRAEAQKAQPWITREELVHLAGEGKTSGILTPEEHRMIHEVIQLKSKTCREIMTPRDHIVCVQHDTPVAELLELARTKDVDRLPVYDREKKTFVGVVNLFDVLSDEAAPSKRTADYMRPPQLVADYTPVDHVLPRMRVTRQPMVLVTDDRFEVIGLVSLDDVLEEVIGSL
jgi:putative hemolysin